MHEFKFKNAKKLLTTTMASAMLFGATSVTFANTTIVVNTTEQDNTYVAYQLMTLKVGTKPNSEEKAYAYTINEKYREALKKVLNKETDAEIITTLEGIQDMSTEARTFADALYAEIRNREADNEGADAISTNGTFNLTDGERGYYLIAQTNIPADGKDKTLVMLNTLEDETLSVNEKRGVPTLDKHIVENNTEYKYQDAGLGDEVTYKLTGTMPENIDAYKTYKYIMHDTLPEGLDFVDGSVRATIDGNDVDVTVGYTDHTLTFSFGDIKEKATLTKYSEVVVTYRAKVNDKAIIGNGGNKNIAKLEFSNDPYFKGEGGTTYTPEDTAKVFSFSVVVNKVDKDKNKLSGAEFHLEKWDGEEYVPMIADDVESRNVETRIEDNGTKFVFETLDVGKYMLVEDKAPTGYNKADNLLFEIKAEYGKDATTEEDVITRLYAVDENGNELGDLFSVSSDSDLGTLSTDIINTTGIKLPSTGSTGAIMVYCASGIALTIGVATLVIARKKKNI